MGKFHEVKEFVWRSVTQYKRGRARTGTQSLSLTGGYSPYENPTQAILAKYLPLDPICRLRIKLHPPVLHLRLEVLSNSVDQRREGFPQGEEYAQRGSQANSSERNPLMNKVRENSFPCFDWLLLCRRQSLHFPE